MANAWRFVEKHPGFRLAKYEVGLYQDLWRWLRGQTLIPTGAVALSHPPGRLQMLGFITSVLVIEMVVVHLLLPTRVLRIVALLLSLWAIVFVWGLIAAERIRPSYVTNELTVLRRGKTVFVEVPMTVVRSKRADRTFESAIVISEGELTVGGPAGTDTLLVLSEPVQASPDRYPWQRGSWTEVTRVRFYGAASR
ncbi:hypothetical protein [Corynebacterium sp. HMSC078H07]|uniref:hypothetical protein n=1 Tax=Corynebacterium sp. HMSC078H07 TaxID=1739379 RepID=UPI0008A28F5A|nr:hypothetical protein [Corynebacterium sp. HMSC078H07]OFR68364.1 hypothetical protein HMPREF2875_05955 [Corynebacterium sp. HMSC078H07]